MNGGLENRDKRHKRVNRGTLRYAERRRDHPICSNIQRGTTAESSAAARSLALMQPCSRPLAMAIAASMPGQLVQAILEGMNLRASHRIVAKLGNSGQLIRSPNYFSALIY